MITSITLNDKVYELAKLSEKARALAILANHCRTKIDEADANLATHRIALQTVISQLTDEVTDEAISNDEVEDSIGNK